MNPLLLADVQAQYPNARQTHTEGPLVLIDTAPNVEGAPYKAAGDGGPEGVKSPFPEVQQVIADDEHHTVQHVYIGTTQYPDIVQKAEQAGMTPSQYIQEYYSKEHPVRQAILGKTDEEVNTPTNSALGNLDLSTSEGLSAAINILTEQARQNNINLNPSEDLVVDTNTEDITEGTTPISLITKLQMTKERMMQNPVRVLIDCGVMEMNQTFQDVTITSQYILLTYDNSGNVSLPKKGTKLVLTIPSAQESVPYECEYSGDSFASPVEDFTTLILIRTEPKDAQ